MSSDASFDAAPIALDALLPLHLRISRGGEVLHMGPTFARLSGERVAIGGDIFDALEVLRPRRIVDADLLFGARGRRLYLRFRDPPETDLVGHVVPDPDGASAVLDLSFGLRSLSRFGATGLSATDFAPTDPTIDLLYLLEARKIAVAETRGMIGRLQGARSRAEEAAFTDALTGLRNRRALGHVLHDVQCSGQPFAICQVDLDFFKQINDEHGHATGDGVLRAVAGRLTGAVRATDTVARIGGDEFTLVFPGLVDRDMLDGIGARIVSELEAPITAEGHHCRVSASVGISLSTSYDEVDPERMVEDADRALYRSKSAGRARWTFHDPPAASDGPGGQSVSAT